MKKFLLCAIAAIALCACSGSGSDAKDSAKAPVENAAETTSGIPKVLEFSATWCPPCQQLKPIYEKLAEKYEGKIEMVSVDVDQDPELADKYNVKSIPTIVYFDAKGNVVDRTAGFIPEPALESKLEKLLSNK